MENYSRKNKTSNTKEEKTPTRHHIKKGLSAFQKTLATIGSILGIITATITILTFMNNNKSDNKTKSSQTTDGAKSSDTTAASQGETETSSASSDTTQSSNTSSDTSSSQTSSTTTDNDTNTTTSSSSN